MNTQKAINRFGCIALISLAVLLGHRQGKAQAEEAQFADATPFMENFAYDLTSFKHLRANLQDLVRQIQNRHDLFGARSSDDSTLLQPEVRQDILAIWYPLLDNYLMLDAIAQRYAGFHFLQSKSDRQRAFHLVRSVFLTQYRVALDAIGELERNPVVDTILNEAEPPLGLPEGVYAHFKYQYLNVIKAGRYAALEAVAQVYPAASDSDLKQWCERDSQAILGAGMGPGPLMTLANGIAILQRIGQSAWFPVQKGIAEWMGKTKVWRPKQYLIIPRQIESLRKRLQPGDILLERREWYLTNVGIPGFWTHAALYVGSAAQREAFSRLPGVQQWLGQHNAAGMDELILKRYPRAHAGLQQLCKDGKPAQVIEALSPGVGFTSLNYSAACDSLAVLRPRLPVQDRAAAVVRAMRYFGRPYDYDFDFGSDHQLVCTELIVKAYLPGPDKKGIALPLEHLMGRVLTPANAFVRQFDRTYGTPRQQLELIEFLDGYEKEQLAAVSGAAIFRETWKRPKWHIFIQNDPGKAAP